MDPEIALITGASSGIGKAVALELARRKFKLCLTARREKELGEVAAEVEKAGGEALVQAGDVADRAAVERAAKAAEQRFGRIDILVAAAGIGMPRIPLEKVFDTDAVEQTFRVNLFGVVYAIGAVLPGMLARKSGQIAVISSLAGYRGLPRSHAYGGSKAGVNVLLEGLRIDLRGRGVGVTTVNPGFVDTPLVQKERDRLPFLVPADAAARTIVAGILKRKRIVEFPFPLVAAVRLGRALVPDWLYERAVSGRGRKT